ncbi:MAG: glycosyltransferase family 2 protein [Candidatus Peregrinibacteria bacterium]
MISVLIPVFNEQESIESTIRRAAEAIRSTGEEFEILVMDDGSTDRTKEILRTVALPELRVLTNHFNRGYGTMMKMGIRHARGTTIATTDADGTYPIEDLPKLLSRMRETDADMVVGARTKKGASIPLMRRPAKAVVSVLANALAGFSIPDNNSGMRVFKRSLGEEFMHLYPRGFSFTLTITLAALTSGYIVEYVPIDYFKRIGKSTMGGWNGLSNFINFLGLIIRIVTYFRPIRFFSWPGGLLLIAGFCMILFTLFQDRNISDAGLFVFLSGLQISLFGLLAEIIVRHRQAPAPQEKISKNT